MFVKRVIIPSSFCPTPFYFALLHTSLFEVIIDYSGYFYKQTFRNRANVLSSQGVKSLVVPVVGGRKYGVPLKNIKIDYSENWIHKHLKSLETYYYSSPFYEIVIDDITKLYNKNFVFLWELNKSFINYFTELLSLEKNFIENFDNQIKCNDNDCIDLRKIYSPKRKYLDKFKNLTYTKYYQLYHTNKIEFHSELSVFDIVFNTGAEAGMIIRKMFDNFLNK